MLVRILSLVGVSTGIPVFRYQSTGANTHTNAVQALTIVLTDSSDAVTDTSSTVDDIDVKYVICYY